MNKEIQAAILRAAGRFIDKRISALDLRFKALEERPVLKGDPGRDGEDGKDAPPIDQAAIVAEVVKQIPAPKDGRDGPALDEVIAALAPSVQKHLDAIPHPKDGERGADGKSLTLDDIAPLLRSMQAEWALDFERRAQALFQKAVDEIPKPANGKDGRDGVDGIGWDSMRVEHDGRRDFELIFTKGDADHAFKFTIPCVIDAGFYREGMLLQKGDGVTFGGSYWIAQTDTDTKPGLDNPDYRLAVKKGRDAR